MSPPVTAAGPQRGRIEAIDTARGVALVGMIVFHFVYDLEMFGVVAPGTMASGFWYAAARVISAGFLFLVGIGLVLAHGNGIRWRAFGRRALVILAAALMVSAATWTMMPDQFVYFGILHVILFSSCASLAFVRAPVWMALLAAAFVLLVWVLYGRGLPLDPWLGWTGLAVVPRPSIDLIPVVPWLAVTLLGIAAARTIRVPDARLAPAPVRPVLNWLGRHSLSVYLLHQPILMASIWLVLTAVSAL